MAPATHNASDRTEEIVADVTAAILVKDDRVLIAQRSPGGRIGWPDFGTFPAEKSRETNGDILYFPTFSPTSSQACGRPVMAYADWGAFEAAVHGATRLLCPSAAVDGFDENLERLIVRADLRDAMGAAARNHIMQYHNKQRN